MHTRRLAILLSLTLAGCSFLDPPLLPEAAYKPPSQPTETAIASDLAHAAGEEKLTGPFQISAVQPTDHGPGVYYFCLKQTNPPTDKRRTYFAVFANGEEYKGVRSSVIIDACETQTYGPAPAVTPIAPSPAAATDAKHRRHRASGGSTE
jgi:hypothetical protein